MRGPVRERFARLSHADVDTRTLVWIAIALYAGFAVLRIALSLFPKSIDVMPDELRYLDLARSLSTDGSLTIRGEETSFQKILYPLLLFPAMMFQDTVSQVRAIGVLSSLYVCSAVFPTLIMSRRIFANRLLPNLTAMALVLVMPDMCYSMTFMSESLYFPVALWIICLLWSTLCCRTKWYPVLCACSGLACYAGYLCKEVAAAFAIAFCVVLVMLAVRRRMSAADAVMGLACFLAGFLAPFFVMKATLFNGMGNSYNQTDPAILLSPYTWAFAVYALVTDFTYLMVGFCFFCLVFPLIGWRGFSSNEKRLLAFSLIALAVGLLVVLYTISIREDVGHVALRQHLRYVIALFIPLMLLFVKQVGTTDFRTWRKSPRKTALLTAAVVGGCLLAATMFGSANLSQGFDNSQFHLLRDFIGWFDPLAQQEYDITARTMTGISTDETLLKIEPGVWLSRLAVILFIVLGTIGLLGRHRKRTLAILMAVVFALCIGNNIAACKYNWKAYSVPEDQVSETVEIDKYLNALPKDAKVLIVNDSERTGMNNMTDTYIQNRKMTYRYVTNTTFAADVQHGYLNQAAVMGMAGLTGDKDYGESSSMARNLSHIDYILVNKNQNIRFRSSNVKDTGIGNHINFTLYQVTDGNGIRVDAKAPNDE